eukprot:TRINITY_DN74778_c0_g1_i1.p1 TRINITY_DN74778_c0_g1~~TRINITY_DN74778_c0_g1_i1.p1  ORF type:complete len:669 (+),score=116.87 TRINITY_DN74778_c0_g1_i1:36-2009(+)
MDDAARAAAGIAACVWSSYGPFGQDQLVVCDTKKLVTNSASRILDQARAGSPVARLLLEGIRGVAKSLGDGAGELSLMLAGALEHAADLVREGKLQQVEVARCFSYIETDILPSEVEPLLRELLWRPSGRTVKADASTRDGRAGTCQTSLSETEAELIVRGVARGFFGASFAPNVSDQLWRLCWSWLRANTPNASSPGVLATAARRLRRNELVRVAAPDISSAHDSAGADAGAGASASAVVNAHLLSGVLAHASMPAAVEAGSAIILDDNTAPLSLRMSSPSSALAGLGDVLTLSVERLWQLGVRVALCAAEVHEEWRGALERRGILLLHLVESSELKLLSRAGGGAACRVRLATDDANSLRRALFPLAAFRPLSPQPANRLAAGRALWVLAQPSASPHSWLLLRAPSVALAAEYQHAIMRFLRTLEVAFQNAALLGASAGGAVTSDGNLDSVVYGGLAFELALARRVHRSRCVQVAPSAELADHGGTHDDLREASESGQSLRERRLQSDARGILRAGLLSVLEAFVSNLTSGASSQDARRQAHRLLVEDEGVLESAFTGLCLRRMATSSDGKALCGFAASPGTAMPVMSDAEIPLETRQLKLDLLRAFCGIGRQVLRLDFQSLRRRCPNQPAQLPSAVRGGDDASSSEDDDEDDDE